MHIFTQPCGGALRSASMPMQLKMSSSPIRITTVLAISTASQARFHLQERELTYATGRYMRYPRLSHSFEVEDICGIVRLNYAWRDVLQWRRGTCTWPDGACGGGPFGGTSIRPGQDQPRICRAPLRRSHFYQKMASSSPFTGAFHMGEMLEDFDRLLDLAHDESHIVSDHDPLFVKLYSAPSPELKGVAVRLDVPPSGVAPNRADYPSHD
jgi:hypothetical protein